MKLKDFRVKYEKKLKQIDKRPKKFIDFRWVITITLIAFIISLFFSSITDIVISRLNATIGVLITLLIIFIGVMFDMIGVAVTAADLKPFNSVASKKVKGSITAIGLIKNAEKVAAFCNDVIGDVCGVVSGSVGILISGTIAKELSTPVSATTLIITALVAALTIGGKAIGKSYAINKSDVIIFRVSKVISIFKEEKNGK